MHYFFFLKVRKIQTDAEMINFSSFRTFQEPCNPLNKFNTVKLSVFRRRAAH